MLKFIKEMPATEFIGLKKWWEIGDSCEVLIGFSKKSRSINIRDSNGIDITLTIAKKLDIKIQNESNISQINLTRTIDSYSIECPEESLTDLLKQIDFLCKN